jgi:hypothetical protein
VINKLRALNSWYTKGIENGSHLRVSVNAADSITQLKDVIEDFFFELNGPAKAGPYKTDLAEMRLAGNYGRGQL